MGQLVRVVVGEWQRLAHGTWMFDMDHTQVKYNIVLRENETYGDLVAMVRGKYRVLLSEHVALTNDFPEWMKVPGDYTTPPVDILEDKDVELFMAVRMDYVNLTLCVAYGNVEVGHYHTMRREEFGLTEDGTDVVPPKPILWRGFRSGGYLQVSEEKLMTICSSEQMVEIRRNAVRLTREEIFQPLIVIDENSSQTDSSDEMDIFTPNAEGMIRLEEIPIEPPIGANLTLAITAADDITGRRVESYGKGKGIITGPDITGGQLFVLQMGSGSGYANTEGADVALEEDVAYAGEQKGKEEIDSNNQLYVGQVFVDQDAFKVHMSLHALANKYRYFVRKSGPGKVVLKCSGVNCPWRLYATKIIGCPRFEIKTLDSNHRCTVSERGEFRRHATSSIVGGMMRSKYVGTGSGPRPGALREMMKTDHSILISYWTAWKSREIAIENGRGNVEAAYSALPSYLQQLAVAIPRTLVALETSKGPGGVQHFKHLFLSFGASQKGFDFVRKVVIIDGTHLKGKFAGCLLTASAQDGNYQIFPIAFGIVPIMDMVYPMAKHCACLLHLQRNVQTIFKKKHLMYLLGRAARAYKLEDFYLHFNELKVVDGTCADYLIRVGLEHWARSHFDGARYNIMTSNLVESLNAALSEAREYPIVPLLEYIRSMMMGWFSSRRDAVAKNVGALTPKVTDIVMRNFTDST
ncbi:PREDICTED: uncharacterized protein LOC106314149 [Brassica oleracea var. oleracea]|uniref:uncharacterized protein LOC106314149 n=1 Tax=Brassica oleracea var. oleracea TaxID=109376 RepID=UPI0006A6F780|nr:PREDICTED: uncharacterized protein LOC106314149 [Brassica oleracea var. oleracea]